QRSQPFVRRSSSRARDRGTQQPDLGLRSGTRHAGAPHVALGQRLSGLDTGRPPDHVLVESRGRDETLLAARRRKRPRREVDHQWGPAVRDILVARRQGPLPPGAAGISILEPNGDRKPRRLISGPETASLNWLDWPRLSPSGRWLAYVSEESGRREVYVRPFPGSGSRWAISKDGGDQP